MEMNEHFYSEDPTQGPSDVKTTLKDVNYFFLGNGLIQAAVQVCAGNEGTPLGLLLMNPDNFTPKRGALTFDAEKGLQATGISIISDGRIRTALPEDLQATWIDIEKIPAVQVVWQSEDFGVCERFYCPDRQTSRLVREIRVQNLSKAESCLGYPRLQSRKAHLRWSQLCSRSLGFFLHKQVAKVFVPRVSRLECVGSEISDA